MKRERKLTFAISIRSAVPSIYSVLSVEVSPGGKCKGMTCRRIFLGQIKYLLLLLPMVMMKMIQNIILTNKEKKENNKTDNYEDERSMSSTSS